MLTIPKLGKLWKISFVFQPVSTFNGTTHIALGLFKHKRCGAALDSSDSILNVELESVPAQKVGKWGKIEVGKTLDGVYFTVLGSSNTGNALMKDDQYCNVEVYAGNTNLFSDPPMPGRISGLRVETTFDGHGGSHSQELLKHLV